MANQEVDITKRSVVVKMLADIASQGTYNNITVVGARNMNVVFELVANLINDLEAEELEAEEVVVSTGGEEVTNDE